MGGGNDMKSQENILYIHVCILFIPSEVCMQETTFWVEFKCLC